MAGTELPQLLTSPGPQRGCRASESGSALRPRPKATDTGGTAGPGGLTLRRRNQPPCNPELTSASSRGPGRESLCPPCKGQKARREMPTTGPFYKVIGENALSSGVASATFAFPPTVALLCSESLFYYLKTVFSSLFCGAQRSLTSLRSPGNKMRCRETNRTEGDARSALQTQASPLVQRSVSESARA